MRQFMPGYASPTLPIEKDWILGINAQNLHFARNRKDEKIIITAETRAELVKKVKAYK